MDLLVCAATLPEFRAFWWGGESWELSDAEPFVSEGSLAYLLTGVGIPCTLGRLLPLLREIMPRRIVNIGIAGAYPGSGIAIGDIVVADSEVYGDVGFELPDAPGFRHVSEAPFGGPFYAEPIPLLVDPALVWEPAGYRRHTARGCTVNACTGTERTGALRESLFAAGFETMEGAAVAQAAHAAGVPVSEVRAISNLAARRDMRPENIERALTNLRDYLQTCRERMAPR